MSVIKFMKLMIRRTKLIVLCTYKFFLVFRRLFVGFSGIWEVSNYKITKIFISTQSKKRGKVSFWNALTGPVGKSDRSSIRWCHYRMLPFKVRITYVLKSVNFKMSFGGCHRFDQKTNEILLRISALILDARTETLKEIP